MSTENTEHDAYVSSLQRLDDFDVDRVIVETGAVVPYMRIHMPRVIERAIISEWRLRYDVDAVNAEILHWGRLVALCKHVWNVRDREYKRWKAGKVVELYQQLYGLKKSAKGEPQAPTDKLIESHYRIDPDYMRVNHVVDLAETAHASAVAIHEAFRSKARTLERDIWRAADGSLQRRSP